MKSIASFISKILLLIAFVLVAGLPSLLSNEVTIQGSAPRVVQEGERFQLNYVVNARSSSPNLVLPAAFRLLSGPGTSQSTNTQFINGQVTTSFSLTFTYIIEALTEGTYTIEPVTVNFEGKALKSNKIGIEIVKVNKSPASRSGQGQSQGQQGQQSAGQSGSSSSSTQGDPNFFVRIVVNKRDVYQGESLLATLKVYTTLNLTNFEKLDIPKFSGFFKEDIPTPSQISFERENVNGKIYQVGIIAKYLLFPQRSGTIEIDPMSLEAIASERVRNNNDPFDMFFGGNVRRFKVQNISPAVKINVKPLPEPRPGDFNGGVGQLRLDATISKDEVVTNDAINFKLKFSGSGNIKFLNNPELKFPTDFEVYDPKKDVNVKASESGATGVVLWDYLIIPRYAGKYKIPDVSFSYFDPQSQSYKKLSAGPYDINVIQGAIDSGAPMVSGISKRDVKNIGSDIRFIATGNLKLSITGNYLYGTTLYWVSIIAPLTLFGIFYAVRKKHEQDVADIARMRNKKAAKVSKNRLKSARKFIKENKDAQVYDEVLRALWQYMADKLVIDQARLNRDNALDMLTKRSVSQQTIDKVVELADSCEMAHYAPATVKIPAPEAYIQAVNLLVQLEREIC